MMWTNLEISGHRADLLERPGESPFGLIFLHDQDGRTLRDSPEATAWLERQRVACLCPFGGPSWWSDRRCSAFDPSMSAERWLLDDVLTWLDSRWQLPPKAVALAGVGMGGQGALRLGFKHPERFPIVAALDAALDHHELYGTGTPLDDMYTSREQCRQDTAILHIHPVRQPAFIAFAADPDGRWFRGNDRLHEKLGALGVPHAFEPQGGHIVELLDTLLVALARAGTPVAVSDSLRSSR